MHGVLELKVCSLVITPPHAYVHGVLEVGGLGSPRGGPLTLSLALALALPLALPQAPSPKPLAPSPNP